MPLNLRFSVLLSILLAICGCRSNPEESALKWGHFKDLDLRIDGAAFLFGLSPQDELHTCFSTSLPQGLDPEWLKAEVYAAVNLWAMSIGRAIPLVFDDCKGKPALRIGFAPAPVPGDFIGYTLFQDGERQIFLNPKYDWEDIGTSLGFNKMPDLKGAAWPKKASFILPILEQGLYGPIVLSLPGVTGKIRQASFATILHELGHAYGLCDLYQDKNQQPDFNSNCSTVHRASQITPEEVMGAGTRPGTARFRLSAEDRLGLKTLAKRPGFPSRGWSSPDTPLGSQAVLARTLSGIKASEDSPASANDNTQLRLEGPTQIVKIASSGMSRVTLLVRAPLSITHAFLWEQRGNGPFQQLTAEGAEVKGNERVWTINLELEDQAEAFTYQVAGSQGEKSGPAAIVSFKI